MKFFTLIIYMLIFLLFGCAIYRCRNIDYDINDYVTINSPSSDKVVQNVANVIVNTVPTNVLSPIVTEIKKFSPDDQSVRICPANKTITFPLQETSHATELPWDGEVQKCDGLEPNMFYPKSFMVL